MTVSSNRPSTPQHQHRADICNDSLSMRPKWRFEPLAVLAIASQIERVFAMHINFFSAQRTISNRGDAYPVVGSSIRQTRTAVKN